MLLALLWILTFCLRLKCGYAQLHSTSIIAQFLQPSKTILCSSGGEIFASARTGCPHNTQKLFCYFYKSVRAGFPHKKLQCCKQQSTAHVGLVHNKQLVKNCADTSSAQKAKQSVLCYNNVVRNPATPQQTAALCSSNKILHGVCARTFFCV